MKTAALIVAALWCAGPTAADTVVIQINPIDAATPGIICSAMLADETVEIKRAWGTNTMFDRQRREAIPADIAAFAAVADAFDSSTMLVTTELAADTPLRPSVIVTFRPNLETDREGMSMVLPGTHVPSMVTPIFAAVFDGDCLDAGRD